jgi:TonB family protein
MMSDLYLTLAVQSTVVLGSGSAVVLLLRKKSAALRHAVWAASFVLLLLLPVLPQNSWLSVTQTVTAPPALAEPLYRTRITVRGEETVDWVKAGLVVHSLVAIAFLLRSVAARMLLEARPVQTPMVVGLWRPRVLWPEGAEEWSAERRDAAWQHERKHIERLDLWWELLGLIGTALYWPHPLVWRARKKMTEECEQACDDGVLAGGLAASRYAGHLVEIAREMRDGDRNISWAGGLAMTRGKNLEQRVRVLLDETRARDAMTRKTVGLVALCALGLLVPLSGYKLLAQTTGGGLSGVVRDVDGKPIDGAKVTVWWAASKEITRTNAEGQYSLAGLPAGSWNVSVWKEGFAAMEMKGLHVEAKGLRFDPVLQLGKLAENVMPAGGPPVPPPPNFAGKVIQVGNKLQSSKLLARVPPVYPADCKSERVQGVVLLQALIGQEGFVESVTQLNQLVDERLARAAIDAVRQWRYSATLLNGQPVAVLTEVEVTFTLAP